MRKTVAHLVYGCHLLFSLALFLSEVGIWIFAVFQFSHIYIQSRYNIGSNEKRTFPEQRSIEISKKYREQTHLTELPDLGKVHVFKYINTTVFIRSRISTQRYSDILYTNFLNTGQSSQERFLYRDKVYTNFFHTLQLYFT